MKLESLPHRELQSRSGEKFSLSAVVSEAFGLKDLFVHHEIIPPGRRASSGHSHTLKEEMVYVISGSPIAVVKGEVKVLQAGECFAFAPGSENFHYLENRTGTSVEVLVISSNPPGDSVVYDPSETR